MHLGYRLQLLQAVDAQGEDYVIAQMRNYPAQLLVDHAQADDLRCANL